MDNVLVDFRSGIQKLDDLTREKYKGRFDDVPGIFSLMEPMPMAVQSYEELSSLFDTYILSTAPWDNPSAWSDKLEWVKKHLGKPAYKRLTLTHHKNLNIGDFLVDDRPGNGAEDFQGEWIEFGSEEYPDWESVVRYLRNKSTT